MRYDPPVRSSQLPDWAVRLLQRLSPWRKRDVIVGDFAEVFDYIASDQGRGHALAMVRGAGAQVHPLL